MNFITHITSIIILINILIIRTITIFIDASSIIILKSVIYSISFISNTTIIRLSFSPKKNETNLALLSAFETHCGFFLSLHKVVCL